jgi:hypothetical protein
LFNLQHNTARTARQQCTHLIAYEESANAAAREVERLRHENVILRSDARSPLELDRELQEVYRHLSGVEHGWNYTRMLLNIAHEEVDIRTHRITHLETQDANLEERAKMIADLKQQLLELHGQVPPEPADTEEIDAMSGIDEE